MYWIRYPLYLWLAHQNRAQNWISLKCLMNNIRIPININIILEVPNEKGNVFT